MSEAATDLSLAAEAQRARVAATVAAMLDRWSIEDTGIEPDWDVEQVPALALATADGSPTPSSAT